MALGDGQGQRPSQLRQEGATDGQSIRWNNSTSKWEPTTVTGTGDVVGPAVAVDDRLATFDSTTGKLIQDGGSTVADVLARANHTGTQTASTISDFDTEVANNSAVTANTAKVTYPSADSTKVGHIAVTQAVNLDTIESDTTTNNAKVTNATHTGDVTGSGALTIADDTVSNAKMANVATSTIKGRVTASTGDPEDLTATQARSLLNVADGADVTDATNVNSAGAVMNTDYNANTMMVATSDDTPVASTATQVRTFINVENGSEANNITDVNATDLTDGGETSLHTHPAGSSVIESYTPTLTNASNTTSEIDIIKATIPANDIADGDVLVFFFTTRSKQNSGGDVVVTADFYYGTDTFELRSLSRSTSATVGQHFWEFKMQRAGSELWVSEQSGSSWKIQDIFNISSDYFTSTNGTVMTPSGGFTSELDMKVSITFDTASAEVYYNPLAARVYKITT